MAAIEHFSVTSSSDDSPTVRATVGLTEQLGSEAVVYVRLDGLAAETLGTESQAELSRAFMARLDPRVRTGPGQQLELVVDPRRAHFFDPADGRCSRGLS